MQEGILVDLSHGVPKVWLVLLKVMVYRIIVYFPLLEMLFASGARTANRAL